jgi:predicted phosphohydrolase
MRGEAQTHTIVYGFKRKSILWKLQKRFPGKPKMFQFDHDFWSTKHWKIGKMLSKKHFTSKQMEP